MRVIKESNGGIDEFNGGIEEFNDLSHGMKKIVMKLLAGVDVKCEKCKRRALKTIAGVEGVESISLDAREMKLTVIGSLDPAYLMVKLNTVFCVEPLSVALLGKLSFEDQNRRPC